MKSRLLVATVTLGVVVSTARANPGPMTPTPLTGSDMLFAMTNDIIDRCTAPAGTLGPPGSGNLNLNLRYVGGGSMLGGWRMNKTRWGNTVGGVVPSLGQQQLAPQARFLTDAECDSFNPDQGQGIAIGLDGISILHDNTELSLCRVLRHAGCMTVEDRNDSSRLGYGTGVPGVADHGVLGEAVADMDGNPNNGIQYCFNHWSEALRILYAGQHGSVVGLNPCTLAPPVSGPVTKRCNSDVRRTLVETWSNLFDEVNGGGDGGCQDSHCAALKHAFRPDDLSGTTDVFLSLIGVAGVGTLAQPVKTFCNGLEGEDLDPIRRDCNHGASSGVDPDSVCTSIAMRYRNLPWDSGGNPSGMNIASTSAFQVAFAPFTQPYVPNRACTGATAAADCAGIGGLAPAPNSCLDNLCQVPMVGDLGLVLSISPIPSQILNAERTAILMDPTTGQPYNPGFDLTPCSAAPIGSGNMRLASMTFALSVTTQRCPSGSPRAANKCPWPVLPAGLTNGKANWFNCKTKRTNRLVGASAPWINYDARVYNRIPRHPQTGDMLLPDNISGPGGVKDPRFVGGGDTRIHMQLAKTALPNHPSCKINDATRQIGCLVQADPCSIGFAGLEGVDVDAHADDSLVLGTNQPLYLATPDGSMEVQPIGLHVSKLNDGCTLGLESRYPLAHTLWLNSAQGFYPGGFPIPGTSATQSFVSIGNQVDADPGDDVLGFETAPSDRFPGDEPNGLDLADPWTYEKAFAQCVAAAGDPGSIVMDHFIPLKPGAHRLFQCAPAGPVAIGPW